VALSGENPQWVHLTGTLDHATWASASHVELDRSGWGIAMIDGVGYDVCVSYDGDGYLQMADSELERYERLHAGNMAR
jgi:hypothetical protein